VAQARGQISALLLAALSKHLELATLAVEFWSSLALQERRVREGGPW